MEFFFTIAGAILIMEGVGYYFTDADSTDKPKEKWWHIMGGESNLRVYKDHATGVQYVKSSLFDKLTVRINADGTPYTGE